MRKRYLFTSALAIGLLTSSIMAAPDFAKDEAKYLKMCERRSGYRANKNTCEAFESYLQKQSSKSDKAAADIKNKLKNTKNGIDNVLDLIKKNNALIESKTREIKNTNATIISTEKDIIKLEDDIVDRLALMQEITGENFIVDFLMSSTSLEDFLLKMDGISAINESNNDVVKDLGYARKKLKTKQVKLNNDKIKLDESKRNKDILLKEFRSNEATLFKDLEEEHRKNTVYNSKLNEIDLDDPALNNDVPKPTKPSKPKPPTTGGEETTKPPTTGGGETTKPPTTGGGGTTKPPVTTGWVRPVAHATVTATAWYYPQSFGGAWHPGIDLANRVGTPVIAPANGVVLATGWDARGYGNYMITAHQMGGDTYTFIMAHMSKPGWGSSLKQGQQIGSMGSTGNSSGPHTHVEVFKHKSKTLKQVVNTYKNNGDLYFGLGYNSTGNCGKVCRLKPQDFFNLSYYQVY